MCQIYRRIMQEQHIIPPESFVKKTVRILCACMGGALVWYFSGPLLEELAREMYTQYYTYRFGAPDVLSLDYWTTFFATRGHLGGLAYQYGSTFASIVSAYLFSQAPELLELFKTHAPKAVVPKLNLSDVESCVHVQSCHPRQHIKSTYESAPWLTDRPKPVVFYKATSSNMENTDNSSSRHQRRRSI